MISISCHINHCFLIKEASIFLFKTQIIASLLRHEIKRCGQNDGNSVLVMMTIIIIVIKVFTRHAMLSPDCSIIITFLLLKMMMIMVIVENVDDDW